MGHSLVCLLRTACSASLRSLLSSWDSRILLFNFACLALLALLAHAHRALNLMKAEKKHEFGWSAQAHDGRGFSMTKSIAKPSTPQWMLVGDVLNEKQAKCISTRRLIPLSNAIFALSGFLSTISTLSPDNNSSATPSSPLTMGAIKDNEVREWAEKKNRHISPLMSVSLTPGVVRR